MNVTKRATFTSVQIAAAARKWGPMVGPLPADVKGDQLLWALAGNESNFGRDCGPRHEPAYDVGGRYALHVPMPTLLAHFGAEAACSYGPLQIMLCNAPGLRPASFDSLDVAMEASVQCLNGMLRHWHPKDVCEIGEIWNAGHITPDPQYTNKLQNFYFTSKMPVA